MSTEQFKPRTADELLRRATEYEAMASGATVAETAAALLRLAERCRVAAAARQKTDASVQQPEESAAESGVYEQLNIFGTPNGTAARVEQGERLPAAPRGFTWRLIE